MNTSERTTGILSTSDSSEPSRAEPRRVSRSLLYLCKVSDVKQVEGLEQVALSQVELGVTSGQKGADIFQAQELKTDGKTRVKPTGRSAAAPQRRRAAGPFPSCLVI